MGGKWKGRTTRDKMLELPFPQKSSKMKVVELKQLLCCIKWFLSHMKNFETVLRLAAVLRFKFLNCWFGGIICLSHMKRTSFAPGGPKLIKVDEF